MRSSANRDPQRDEGLHGLLAHARPVPLTDQVRLDQQEFADRLAREIDRADDSASAQAAAAELQSLIRRAPRIPLTGQVRVDLREAQRQLSRLHGGG